MFDAQTMRRSLSSYYVNSYFIWVSASCYFISATCKSQHVSFYFLSYIFVANGRRLHICNIYAFWKRFHQKNEHHREYKVYNRKFKFFNLNEKKHSLAVDWHFRLTKIEWTSNQFQNPFSWPLYDLIDAKKKFSLSKSLLFMLWEQLIEQNGEKSTAPGRQRSLLQLVHLCTDNETHMLQWAIFFHCTSFYFFFL